VINHKDFLNLSMLINFLGGVCVNSQTSYNLNAHNLLFSSYSLTQLFVPLSNLYHFYSYVVYFYNSICKFYTCLCCLQSHHRFYPFLFQLHPTQYLSVLVSLWRLLLHLTLMFLFIVQLVVLIFLLFYGTVISTGGQFTISITLLSGTCSYYCCLTINDFLSGGVGTYSCRAI